MRRKMVISVILVRVLLVPAGLVKGEKMNVEKVRLIPGLVKEVEGVVVKISKEEKLGWINFRRKG